MVLITGLDLIWTIGSLVVLASILTHGISATPLIRGYGRFIARNTRHKQSGTEHCS